MKSLEAVFILVAGFVVGCVLSLAGMPFFPASVSSLIVMAFATTTLLRFREQIPIFADK